MTTLADANQLRMHGFIVRPLNSKEPITIAQNTIKLSFNYTTSELAKMSRDEFHEAVEHCQTEMNRAGVLKSFVQHQGKYIADLLGTEDLSFVSVMKMRAIRPSFVLEDGAADHVGLHRESLYASSEQVSFQYNCWMPISEAASDSGMFYVPNSHIIPDQELDVRVNLDDPARVERFSPGHRIGLPYRPKSIERSSILKTQNLCRFIVPLGSVIIFSAMLIHGGGINKGKEMRISMDTGVIPTSRIDDNSPLFAANGKPHYIKL